MKIGMVLRVEFPPDIRVEKEAKSLIEQNHQVYLLCSYSDSKPSHDNYNNIIIRRNKPISWIKNKIHNLLTKILFINWYWYEFINEIVEKEKIEILHVHDLPLVKTALLVKKKFSIPVIFDMHEDWPELEIALFNPLKLWNYPNLLLNRFRKLEKYCANMSDCIITVVEEGEDRLREMGIPTEKIFVVKNTGDLETFDKAIIDEEIKKKFNSDSIILYAGGFDPIRGLDVLIKAMPEVIKEIPKAKLILCGDGRNKSEIKKLTRRLNIEENVCFTGWISFEKVPTYIKLSKVCVIPHQNSKNWNSTIPHKLFQYMSMSKPVIATNYKPLKRIIEEAKCGLLVPVGNSQEIANAIVTLLKDRDLSKELGRNGRKAVENIYNWQYEAKVLEELYRKCIS